MATTPEGAVKKKVKEVIARHYVGPVYTFMPVQGGFGASTLDFLGCHRGRFFAIETKAPGNHLTDRQLRIRMDIEDAGGRVFVISDDKGCSELIAWLTGLID